MIGNRSADCVTFVHHKGGTGKTTACLNIAGWLAKMHQKVLVVDLDPQANATTGLGVDLATIPASMYEVLTDRINIEDIILETVSQVYLAPASVKLLLIERELQPNKQSITLLKKKLQPISHLFNFILIDSPPGSSLLMMNGIVATENIIIPLDTGIFGYETLSTLQALLSHLEKEFKIATQVVMTLLKVFSSSLGHQRFTKEIQTMVKDFFAYQGLVNCEISTIPFSKKICQAQRQGLPISHFAPYSQVGRKYRKIAKDLLNYFIAEK